jgi:hypothetical protein
MKPLCLQASKLSSLPAILLTPETINITTFVPFVRDKALYTISKNGVWLLHAFGPQVACNNKSLDLGCSFTDFKKLLISVKPLDIILFH